MLIPLMVKGQFWRSVFVGVESCQTTLHSSIGDSLFYAYVNDSIAISQASLLSKKQAIRIAEKELFEVFGKDEINSQKPYESYLIHGIWFIKGTLRKGWAGGTFYIFIDARTSEIIRWYHTK